MAYWLVKTEPTEYNYNDLERLGRDRWNGVRNFKALNNIKKMLPSDLVFVYHTGKEKAIIGVAEVVSKPYPDPGESDPKLIVADMLPRYRLPYPVSLKTIKTNPAFQDWELVHLPRLSVMPVREDYWRLVHQLAGG